MELKSVLKSTKYIFGMNSIYLGNNYLWISFEALILPYLISIYIARSLQSIILGLVGFAGIMTGIVFNYLSGFFSDKIVTGIGRRTPFIIAGSLLSLLSLILIMFNYFYIYIVFALYIVIEIGSNLAYGAYQPLIRDIIPENQRGKSSGINGFFTLTGTAMGFGLSGLFISHGMLRISILIIIITISLSTVLTVLTIRHDDLKIIKNDIKFRFSLEFKWFFVSNFLIICGSSGLTFFEYYYIKFSLGIGNAAIFVAIAGLFILIVSAIASAFIGVLSDKIDKSILLFLFPLAGGISIFLLSMARNFIIFLILGSIIGISFGNYYSISNSYLSYIVPAGRHGQFMSVFFLSTGIASAVSPLIYGLVLYMFKYQNFESYSHLFQISSIFYFTGALIIFLKLYQKNKYY
ncbi:MFS transporter [Picrophilus oshimae]|uniref:MFS-type transporter involved in bile tolerance, Atg22 family n=1 Tax=Picrophilus torridus (strain ATCC 700027 / DSM 9790 / JCM 10055 / NBRC 100828 / KAW 2/3) TaxID=1122961 RepID=A0A8G2FXU3_PICTO|nr:MFS transporter [Picrophilus oshimae]SMD31441.1 MFS-type transporter involved in bile tolerance, Atg22 family [Picrophilus oshimae DSM 9789]